MGKFYYDFKFACESMGIAAPSAEFFTTPFIALTTLGSACGVLDSMGAGATFDLVNLARYCSWIQRSNMIAVTVTQPIPGGQVMAGRAAIQALKTMPKSTIVLRAGAYIGGCAAAAYLGLLVGAAAYAAQQEAIRLTGINFNAPFEAFWHAWYGGYATDARTAEMEKELARRREIQEFRQLKTRVDRHL